MATGRGSAGLRRRLFPESHQDAVAFAHCQLACFAEAGQVGEEPGAPLFDVGRDLLSINLLDRVEQPLGAGSGYRVPSL